MLTAANAMPPSLGAFCRFAAVGVALLGLRLAAADTLKVATYNVENYTAADRVVDGVYRKAYPKPENEKQALRGVLRAIDADVLALQEMGPAPYLEELRRDLRREGLDYPHAELLVAADPDRHVAVLSKRPFTAVTRHVDLTFNYRNAVEPVRRGLLEVRLTAGGAELALFAVHLKSRYTEVAEDPQAAERRGLEATAVRDRVLKVFPEPQARAFLVLGDFNDSKDSRAVRAVLLRGKTRIAELLPAADSRGEVWTHHYAKEDSYSRVDHVLASPAVVSRVREQRAHIVDGPETRRASDHRPVVVTLVWE